MKELSEQEYQRFWRRVQQIGLNAYEARSYLVLVGHPRFKALELAARAHVPRQKIYEVLDSLVEKGFAQVIQEKTKLFSAIEPEVAISHYLARRTRMLERELAEQSKLALGLVDDLHAAYSEGQEGRGTLDPLRLVSDAGQIAAHYRRMLSEVTREYVEFAGPPYAVDPLEDDLLGEARARGVNCQILVAANGADEHLTRRLEGYRRQGAEVRALPVLPMKLAIFDGRAGLFAMLDPVVTRPTWTAVVFEHAAMAGAMGNLFRQYWQQAPEARVLAPFSEGIPALAGADGRG
ncbi:MAG: TrmB family transcriptional regulator [Bryobacteraceae bacterium]|nr:TrmB family transcriptional regulator [Bryobacteraceae bacterium]